MNHLKLVTKIQSKAKAKPKKKRLKTVFKNNSQTAHMWASQTQEYGKSPGGNLFFEGDTIYSYGHHYAVAKLYTIKGQKICLINTTSYSSSTSKHQSAVSQAIPKRIATKNVSNPLNIEDSLIHAAGELTTQFFNLFTCNRAYHNTLYWQQIEIGTHNKLCDLFNKPKHRVDVSDDFIGLVKAKLALNIKKTKAFEKKLEAGRRAQAAEREKKNKQLKIKAIEDSKLWVKGQINSIPNSCLLDGVLVRVKGDIVETSDSAEVPLPEAKAFLKRLLQGKAVEGEKVGPFEYESFNGKILTIGCHEMDIEQIKSALSATAEPTLTLVN